MKPAVVALGGGTGLAATLGAVRRYAASVTAIVSVADDGGSSGRLRDALGIPAPGDLRKCLTALGDPESIWSRVFEHRFPAGDLEGHAFGNLVIAGLASATGDFTTALAEAGRLLNATGRVLPATTVPVVLKALAASGTVEGQVKVAAVGRITHVSLAPPDPPAPDDAIVALQRANQVVLGPGSLFTSILAVVAVPAIREALAATPGRKVYVANLREQHPETTGFDVAAHVDAITAHGVEVDVVVRDPSTMPPGRLQVPAVERPLARPDGLGHDPARLADALADLLG